LLGTEITDEISIHSQFEVDFLKGIPDSFDSRTKWGACVHPIRNQGRCGSCWAFGASEALSDRFCIASHGKINAPLSPQDFLSCSTGSYNGCKGGRLDHAWQYLERAGLPSDQCEPYKAKGSSVVPCPARCENGSRLRRHKCKAGSLKVAHGAEATK